MFKRFLFGLETTRKSSRGPTSRHCWFRKIQKAQTIFFLFYSTTIYLHRLRLSPFTTTQFHSPTYTSRRHGALGSSLAPSLIAFHLAPAPAAFDLPSLPKKPNQLNLNPKSSSQIIPATFRCRDRTRAVKILSFFRRYLPKARSKNS